MLNGPFRGIFAIPVTPFDPSGAIDAKSLKRCLEFTVGAGAHGLVAPVNASEFFTLSDEERRLVIRTAVEVVNGRVPVVAGITGLSTQHAVEMAKYAEQAGADALIAMPPFSRPAPLPDIMEYFQALGGVVGIPIFVQNYPGLGGTPMPAEFLARMVQEIEHIDYVKEESVPAGHLMSAVLELGGKALKGVMGGMGGRYLMDEYRRGACGTMPACHITDGLVRLWNLLEAGKEEEARRLHNRMLPLLNHEAIFSVACYKEVLYRRGVIDSPAMRIPSRRQRDKFDQQELDFILQDMADLFSQPVTEALR